MITFRAFARRIRKPYDIRYDPYTQRMQVLDNHNTIHEVIEVAKDELNHLYSVLDKLNQRKKKAKKGFNGSVTANGF